MNEIPIIGRSMVNVLAWVSVVTGQCMKCGAVWQAIGGGPIQCRCGIIYRCERIDWVLNRPAEQTVVKFNYQTPAEAPDGKQH